MLSEHLVAVCGALCETTFLRQKNGCVKPERSKKAIASMSRLHAPKGQYLQKAAKNTCFPHKKMRWAQPFAQKKLL